MPRPAPFWLVDPDAWGRVTIQDQFGSFYALPGYSKVTVKATQKLNINTSPLNEGASYVPQGNEPPNVEIQTEVWTEEQWRLWNVIVLPALRPPTRRQVRPVSYRVSHPIFSAYEIDSIIVVDVSGPEISGPGGTGVFKISGRAYLPLRLTPGAPVGSPSFQGTPEAVGASPNTVNANPPSQRPAPAR